MNNSYYSDWIKLSDFKLNQFPLFEFILVRIIDVSLIVIIVLIVYFKLFKKYRKKISFNNIRIFLGKKIMSVESTDTIQSTNIEPENKKIVCILCGRQLLEIDEFCGSCGIHIKKS